MPPAFCHQLRSYRDFAEFCRQHDAELAAQRAYEKALWGGREAFLVPGYCICCGQVVPLKVDLNWGDGKTPNWRERLECPRGLNNRIRAALDFLGEITRARRAPRLYATEQVTAFFRQLRVLFPDAVGSEYLRDGTQRGGENAAGIRHEDVTALTFAPARFDVVLSFDVLEHVPDFRAALREFARVTAPDGRLIASFPFDAGQPRTVIRASVAADGTITHHLPPEYHGDPIDQTGCLCYQVFGWDVLDEIRAAGFRDAYVVCYWSVDRGYLGPSQLLIVAER